MSGLCANPDCGAVLDEPGTEHADAWHSFMKVRLCRACTDFFEGLPYADRRYVRPRRDLAQPTPHPRGAARHGGQ